MLDASLINNRIEEKRRGEKRSDVCLQWFHQAMSKALRHRGNVQTRGFFPLRRAGRNESDAFGSARSTSSSFSRTRFPSFFRHRRYQTTQHGRSYGSDHRGRISSARMQPLRLQQLTRNHSFVRYAPSGFVRSTL